MQKKSIDNVSVIFIAFKNFENKMKDPNFEYTIPFIQILNLLKNNMILVYKFNNFINYK